MVRTIALVCLSALLFSIPARSETSSGSLNVVTTVAPVTDIVAQIAKGRAQVTGVIPGGVNSHTFDPAPTHARILAAADLIIVNGLMLEAPLMALAEAVKRPETPVVKLGEQTITRADWKFDFSFPESGGKPNPHLWPNAVLAKRYAEVAAAALIENDPAGAERYKANLAAYIAQLDALDRVIFDCVESIPEANRKLVTYHDSFAYFAPRYGMTVIGAVQPSDFAEPSAREVARMIEQIRQHRVPAVFGSGVFPSRVLEQIAKESGARFVDQLSDDSLPGEPGTAEHSYIGMMLNNMIVLADALGGDATCVAPGPGRSE